MKGAESIYIDKKSKVAFLFINTIYQFKDWAIFSVPKFDFDSNLFLKENLKFKKRNNA